MGRPRKHNKHLPRSMLQRRGTYFYVRGDQPWINLGKEYGAALIKYAAIVGERPTVKTVAEAVTHYLESSAKRLKPATLEGYRHSAKNLAEVFGHMALNAVEPHHVFEYLTRKGNVQANRDKALLSATYSHARRIGAFKGEDPAKGLQFRNQEKPRQRYVTDDELDKLIAEASPKLACILRFSYLTGMRQGDVLRVKLADLDDEGIHYTSGKTGARVVIEWSDDLRAVVDEAKRLWRRFGREYLFESRPRGKNAKRGPGPYTTSGLRALWRPVRMRSGVEDVRLHDLRRKAGSDVEEAEATRLLAHGDAKVTRKHYRAKPERVKPVR
jgi:integrase